MSYTQEDIWQMLEQVSDPEVPVLSVVDLGVVRKVEIIDNIVEIDITPTYTGCPAMGAIEMGIKFLMIEKGIKCKINLVLSPAWTTDWMSECGKKKLKAYGIAPPQYDGFDDSVLFSTPKGIICPHCNSTNTLLISQFGSTACKSLYKCLDCLEPFDYFKCHK
ncbi:MAG: phenylacetate-CoA oxygenase subunit PaaJ [Bacteroidetes bacterium]|nr:phenylacetate-CoA oxygenase subunit PaaJ [Bacteroidota bacterium]